MKKYKILHLSNNLVSGGAGKAARTINKALQEAGMQSQMLDLPVTSQWDKFKNTFRAYFDKVPLQFYQRVSKTAFSTANIGIGLSQFDCVKESDIIHLHWVQQGYMGFKDLRYLASSGKKVFINMHDSWWLSGGCHVTHGCNHWEANCGFCPQLNSRRANDLSRRIFIKKRAILSSINPTIICASHWMHERACSSPMFNGFKIVRIPYCIDLEKYRPVNQRFAREKLNLPIEKKLILFGSVDLDDPNKGFHYFRDAVNAIPGDEVEVILFGNLKEGNLFLNKKSNNMGHVSDEEMLVLIYSAADVFVAPSLEDNFPNTVLESISCGTPVVAFDIGGMPDMIVHSKNGFLAQKGNVSELSQGMIECLNDEVGMKTFARNKALESFSYSTLVNLFTQIYQ
ncbi:MAG: glycosyltransferase [Bacteroidetes bacterium]|nr:glycosyltransferase [Bacteroidota bacterium]